MPRQQLRLAIEDAFLPYLRQVLAQNPVAQHATIQAQFAEHMAFLTDFCLRGYPGPGGLTVEFIKGLHRAMFPPNFKRVVTTREGVIVWLIPGEFKTISNNVAESYLHPGKTNVFTPSAAVPQAMAQLVAGINRELAESDGQSRKVDAILAFMDDFFQIHPFVDGNGRVAYILADLLAIWAGMPLFLFSSIRQHDLISLVRAMESRREMQDVMPLRNLLIEYGWPGNRHRYTGSHSTEQTPHAQTGGANIYEAIPSAFLTYVRRNGDKRYLVDRIVSHMAHMLCDSDPLVITDIGAGAGDIAAGVIGWLDASGCPFAYHFIEPTAEHIKVFKAKFPEIARRPEVRLWQCGLEEFVLPESDLILACQVVQYCPGDMRKIVDKIAGAIRPGGMAMVVNTHPDSPEFQMMRSFFGRTGIYREIKSALDKLEYAYAEDVVESTVQISRQDRHTAEGADMLAWYFGGGDISTDLQEAFWSALETVAPHGSLGKKEACFWLSACKERRSYWDRLPAPWTACIEEAWAAYREGCFPVGAAITDKRGNVLFRAHNQVLARAASPLPPAGSAIAHAEINLLSQIDRSFSLRDTILYSTLEPCPMCASATRIGGIDNIRYAVRDPHGGGTGLLNAGPGIPAFLSRPCSVIGPVDDELEAVLLALMLEWNDRHRAYPEMVVDAWRESCAAGVHLYGLIVAEGVLPKLVTAGASAGEMLNTLHEKLSSPHFHAMRAKKA